MRGFRQFSAEQTDLADLRPTTASLRAAPAAALAEREAAWAAEWTPNMVILGDPLPGRSALDAKHSTSPH
jgi:hypothetical protein